MVPEPDKSRDPAGSSNCNIGLAGFDGLNGKISDFSSKGTAFPATRWRSCMSIEPLIRNFFEVFNQRNLDRIANLFSADAEFYFPKTQPLIGRDRILKFLGLLLRQYPRLRFEIQRVIVHDDQAAIHWTNQGINERDLPYENEGVTLMELKDGKINFLRDVFKDTEKF
jgi:uncharacterized protein (TIGR02246 family)